ncbi:MAG: hypothetical protein V7629_09760 [Motiliproteus sp.]
MTKLTTCCLLLAASVPVLAIAEPIALRCVYTEVSFSAAYMSQPETRACPQSRCYYELRFDSAGAAEGRVNDVGGYTVTVEDSRYRLVRQAKNIVVGGMDRASFSINRDDLSYSSSKSTPPAVVLETSGQCQPVQ